MNTAISSHVPMQSARGAARRSPLRRFFGAVARPQSYRNIGYLYVGFPLAIVWFTVLVSMLSVSLSLVVVALLGIPLLVATWYVIRAFANVERGLANVLLGTDLAPAPMAGRGRGNPWVRLRAMSRERGRWRELAFLVVRTPVAVVSFGVAVAALVVPFTVAYAPIHARIGDDFGDWFWSAELHDFASRSPWSWGLVPLGLGMFVASIHLLNGLAGRCRRWTTARLDLDAGPRDARPRTSGNPVP
jgi:hypothetical protein